MSEQIYIQKTEMKKADAIRIQTEADIPENLREAIRIEKNEAGEDMIHMECREGAETAPVGRIVRFEQTEATGNCPHGINAWAISPESEKDRFVEKDGQIYQKPTPTPAAPLSDQAPDWLNGAPITKGDDGSFKIKTDWGESEGKPGEAYWVKYGDKDDGTPDANILTTSEKSFDAYSVCTKDGENIGSLRRFDEIMTEMKKQDPNVSLETVQSSLLMETDVKSDFYGDFDVSASFKPAGQLIQGTDAYKPDNTRLNMTSKQIAETQAALSAKFDTTHTSSVATHEFHYSDPDAARQSGGVKPAGQLIQGTDAYKPDNTRLNMTSKQIAETQAVLSAKFDTKPVSHVHSGKIPVAADPSSDQVPTAVSQPSAPAKPAMPSRPAAASRPTIDVVKSPEKAPQVTTDTVGDYD